ncbi:AGE family epimerase/isomerase [Mitsuaria sp. TWR114]|uniref:AGE family epimerase/isomerase n=1 Tax=Mitsuaria sp. TWR114 TaxID=2601731 RepID=UPI002872D39C|nr:AGE family epimerase/isomerase [Mitsuaria sp. TWR114]
MPARPCWPPSTATGERRYLERAHQLAYNITQRQAQRCGGLIWEHYDTQWQPDWQYNIDNPAHLFRPWGYQPGHLTEWAKLLLQLQARGDALEADLGWALPTADRLFRVAMDKAGTVLGAACITRWRPT